MTIPHISKEGKKRLDALLEKTVEDRTLPALFFGATTADGIIYEECKGEKVFGQPEKGTVDADTTLQIFSMGKFIGSVAVLQGVDKGLLNLDDPDQVGQYCPELKTLPILKGYTDNGKEILEKPTKRITLRMLLSHTAGMGYFINSPDLDRYIKEHGIGEQLAPHATIETLTYPLVYEPGTSWRYSCGIDWAAIMLERCIGKGLEEIYQENIFKPLGMNSTTFYPTEDIKSRLMNLCASGGDDGTIKTVDNFDIMGIIKRAEKPEDVGHPLAGGGLYGSARDYLKLLTAILQSSRSEGGLLSKKSFDLLFDNALPPQGETGSQIFYEELGKVASDLSLHHMSHAPDSKHGEGLGYSLGLLLNTKDSINGRKAGSGTWDGAAKTVFWIDPATGLGAVCCTQMIAQKADTFIKVFNEFERTLYDALVS